MTRQRAPYVVPLLALAAILAGLDGGRAVAWVGLGPKWITPTAAYDAHTMSGTWQGVVAFGADQWTDVASSDFVYTVDNGSNNDITTGGIDGAGNTLAVTNIYYTGSRITRITMTYDSAENWYLGSGAPGGSQIDGRSVAAHEFGHGLGLGHTSGGFCPNDSNRATMCASYPTGTSYMRTLEGDDQNGVSTLYPATGGTPTPVPTDTNTPTPSNTPLPTNTPPKSPGGGGSTDTPTPPPTSTATATLPPTATATATASATASPTATTAPGTATPTAAPTNTATTVPSATATTAPATATPTSAPTNSPTPAPTNTRTPTRPPMCIGC